MYPDSSISYFHQPSLSHFLPLSGATCSDLGHSIDNGNVSYSRDPTEEGLYVESTTVTVSCDEGYRGGGNVTCQNDGNWSSLSLPSCTGEPAIVVTNINTNTWSRVLKEPTRQTRIKIVSHLATSLN